MYVCVCPSALYSRHSVTGLTHSLTHSHTHWRAGVYIKEGIIVVRKGAVVPDNTCI